MAEGEENYCNGAILEMVVRSMDRWVLHFTNFDSLARACAIDGR